MGFREFVERVQGVFHGESTLRVLCADDDPDVRALCVAALERAGYAVDEASDGRDAREKLERIRYAAVLLDLGMPYLHGATLISILQRERPELLRRIVVMTGMSDAVVADVQALVASVLHKPLTLERILGAVSDCCSLDETIVSRRPGAVTGSSSAAR